MNSFKELFPLARLFPLAVMQTPHPPLFIFVQNSSTPLTLDVQFQTNPPFPKENIIQRWHSYMLSGPSFRSAFVFSINSLALSGLPLTSYHLAEAWLSAFSWLWTLVLQLSENITKCLLFLIIHIFSIHFAMNLVLFIHLENVNKLWSNNCIVHVFSGFRPCPSPQPRSWLSTPALVSGPNLYLTAPAPICI